MARRHIKRTLLSEKLNDLARDFVGDGNHFNVYFVTDGPDVVTITYDYATARAHFITLARRRPLQECALEDRRNGVLGNVAPSEEGGSDLLIDFPPEKEPR